MAWSTYNHLSCVPAQKQRLSQVGLLVQSLFPILRRMNSAHTRQEGQCIWKWVTILSDANCPREHLKDWQNHRNLRELLILISALNTLPWLTDKIKLVLGICGEPLASLTHSCCLDTSIVSQIWIKEIKRLVKSFLTSVRITLIEGWSYHRHLLPSNLMPLSLSHFHSKHHFWALFWLLVRT